MLVTIDAGRMLARILGRNEKNFRTLFSFITLPMKHSVQGISIPPCGKSLKYHHTSVTLQYIAPPCVINFKCMIEMFFEMCPIVSPTIQTAIAYRSFRFSSFLHVKYLAKER